MTILLSHGIFEGTQEELNEAHSIAFAALDCLKQTNIDYTEHEEDFNKLDAAL